MLCILQCTFNIEMIITGSNLKFLIKRKILNAIVASFLITVF